ncbi:MAG: hypothetical protein ACKO7P_11365 [Bacteroidota bacterium]
MTIINKLNLSERDLWYLFELHNSEMKISNFNLLKKQKIHQQKIQIIKKYTKSIVELGDVIIEVKKEYSEAKLMEMRAKFGNFDLSSIEPSKISKPQLYIFGIFLILGFVIVFFGMRYIDYSKSNQNTIKKDEIIKSPVIKDTVSSKKEENKMSFCDCYDLMMEINDGSKIDEKKYQIYQDECREMLTIGSSMMEKKEFDKKMSDCQ